jgi:hypothetical protein
MTSAARTTYVNTANGKFGMALNNNFFDRANFNVFSNRLLECPSDSTRMAVYAGFRSPEISNPPAVCTTGNCSWPIIPTVGVCGSCMDITTEIIYQRSSSSFCTVSLDNLRLNGSCTGNSSETKTAFISGRGSGRIFQSLAPDEIQSDSPNLIANFNALGLPGPQSLILGFNDTIAKECAVWYCIQAHKISVNLGQLQDVTVGTWSRAQNLTSGANGNITFVDIPDKMNVEPSDKYSVASSHVSIMSSYSTTNYFIGYAVADGISQDIYPSSDYVGGMHKNLDHIDDWMTRLTRSMTNDARLNSLNDAENPRYHGIAYTNTVFIHVRWLWIGFPTGLVLLSMFYLLFAILQTSKLNVLPWKSDALLPIYMRLEDDLISLATPGINEREGIKKRIGSCRVNLKTENGKLIGFA